jgi:hypothetical protein
LKEELTNESRIFLFEVFVGLFIIRRKNKIVLDSPLTGANIMNCAKR